MTKPIKRATVAPVMALPVNSGIRLIPSSVASSAQTPSSIVSPLRETPFPVTPLNTKGSDPPLPTSTTISSIGLPVNSLLLPLPTQPTSATKPALPTSDPLSQLSGTATAAIAFVASCITIICLGALFLIWRAKKRRTEEIAAVENPISNKEVTNCNILPQHAPTNKRSPFPNRLRANSRRSTWISYVHTSPQGPPVPLRSPPTSPLSSALDNWEPLDGSSNRLRLSTDTSMILDPFMAQLDTAFPTPLPSKHESSMIPSL